jgi:hypothetical protein
VLDRRATGLPNGSERRWGEDRGRLHMIERQTVINNPRFCYFSSYTSDSFCVLFLLCDITNCLAFLFSVLIFRMAEFIFSCLRPISPSLLPAPTVRKRRYWFTVCIRRAVLLFKLIYLVQFPFELLSCKNVFLVRSRLHTSIYSKLGILFNRKKALYLTV